MSAVHNPTSYQVIPEVDPQLQSITGKDLVLAWARDIETKEPRYIGELRKNQTGQKCGCECYSCNLPLEAVNAGKTEFHIRPHFRHPDGAPKGECLVLAARAAALEMLLKEGELFLPHRRQSKKVEGLSGEYYEAWVDAPREPIRIAEYKIEDRVNALLTLEDGRLLKVCLVGSVEASDEESEYLEITPMIRLIVDDPSIAAMSPEELRKRITLIIDDGRWCSHWSDDDLAAQALADAEQKAEDALDWLNIPEGISNELKRETLLHLKAKEILEQEKQIQLPPLAVSSKRELPMGQVIEKKRSRAEQLVQLAEVRLEQHLGEIKPDVLASTIAVGDWPADTLSIEITVTNTIDEERLERIRQKGIPTLEIDVSRMGGKVTLEEFKNLIVHEVAAKRWLYHPWLETEKRNLDSLVEQEAVIALEKQQRQAEKDRRERELMQLPLTELADRYLKAVETYGNLRVQSEAPDSDKIALARSLGQVYEYAKIFGKRGYSEAQDDFLFGDRGNILDRIMSIKQDKCIGYKLNTAWQVINAILQEKQSFAMWQWHSLYLIAIKVYNPTLNAEQTEKYRKWRDRVEASLTEGKLEYRRGERYDRLLCLLFPEMAERINKPLPGGAHQNSVEAPYVGRNSDPYWVEATWKTGKTNWHPEFVSRRKDARWGQIIEMGNNFRTDQHEAQDAVEECSSYFSFHPDMILIAWSEANLIEQNKMLYGTDLATWERKNPDVARKWFGE
ncbi:hypothetical protein [Ferribacterium limneticum]|uniref:hypothetical protein n=1 Tax=Ferribacterium limneticum TaxID=76259 RepID=UPI001CF86855|nr:hypothetical protein [Ferribacterium limneticum]UCV22196.1 hypothetical protein KI613_16960 [Ferribacterium limneticum]